MQMDTTPSMYSRHRAWFFPALALLAVLGLTIVPFLILGTGAYVQIHDNLDSTFIYLRNLAATGTAFKNSPNLTLTNVMNGLPRSALPSGLNATVVLFTIFEPFPAYVINSLIVRCVAFIGMLLLSQRVICRSERPGMLSIILATLFALLPFYTLFGLSVAGQPLFFWSYSRIIRKQSRWIDWAIICVLPFYSSLYLFGIFLVFVLGVSFVVQSIRARRVDRPTLAPLVLVSLGYLAVEWPTILAASGGSWISHRVEFSRQASYRDMVGAFWSTVSSGHYHAATLPVAPIILAVVFAAKALWRSGRIRLMMALLASIILVVLFHASYNMIVLKTATLAPIFGLVQLDRFYFFLPILWLLVFGFALHSLMQAPRMRIVAGTIAFAQLFLILLASAEFMVNVRIVLGQETGPPSFQEYFDPQLFGEIRESIDEPVEYYRVIAVGLDPSILQYNGFYTLDSYQNNYPLSYKHRFRTIISAELSKDARLERYFDAWGSRCYVYSAELGRNLLKRKSSTSVIKELSIDTEAFKQLGGRYILSSSPILNAAQLHLVLRGTFEHPTSFWRVSLYEVAH